MSWLDEVETGHPRSLYRKYRNYGVLDEDQVIATARASGKSGHLEATALLFSQTELFSEPVPIGRARRAVRQHEPERVLPNDTEDRRRYGPTIL